MLDRMQIRHSEAEDIPAIRALYAQPSVYANTLQLPWPSLELWQARLGRLHTHFHSLVAIDQGRLLGQIGIEQFENPRRRHAANIGLAVDEDARGRGVGRALVEAAVELCFGWLNVRRVELEVYTDNLPAQALFTRCGFEREGTARAYALRAGSHVDVHLMARHKG
jgi:L-phenylalanine/L-methionine N-acetyltransferase